MSPVKMTEVIRGEVEVSPFYKESNHTKLVGKICHVSKFRQEVLVSNFYGQANGEEPAHRQVACFLPFLSNSGNS